MLNKHSLAGFTAVGTRDVYIEYDAEAAPLQILTDSAVGSEDRLWVKFYVVEGTGIGGVDIKFTDPPQYAIGYCTGWTTFTMPEGEGDKIWTITKTNISISLSCNYEEIIYLLLSNSTHDECECRWSQNATKILFNSLDTASQMYRPQPTSKRERIW